MFLYANGFSGVHPDKKVKRGQKKVACVGDSITYGYGVSHWAKNNYPTVLNGLLGENYHVGNFGVSGSCVQTTGSEPYAATDVYQQSIAYEADILVFMIGSNDSKPENWQGIEAFRAHYLKLLDSYLQGKKKPKVYLGTPAKAYYMNGILSGVANFDIQPETVDEIVECVREIAKERGYSVIEIHELTKEHPEWFKIDGIHPNADGAAGIAKAVNRVLAQK